MTTSNQGSGFVDEVLCRAALIVGEYASPGLDVYGTFAAMADREAALRDFLTAHASAAEGLREALEEFIGCREAKNIDDIVPYKDAAWWSLGRRYTKLEAAARTALAAYQQLTKG